MNIRVHTAPVEGCAACDPPLCEAEVVPQRNYLPNGDPGHPAEYCENEAMPGSTFCEQHQGEDFWDAADRMYEEARDRALEAQDGEL